MNFKREALDEQVVNRLLTFYFTQHHLLLLCARQFVEYKDELNPVSSLKEFLDSVVVIKLNNVVPQAGKMAHRADPLGLLWG